MEIAKRIVLMKKCTHVVKEKEDYSAVKSDSPQTLISLLGNVLPQNMRSRLYFHGVSVCVCVSVCLPACLPVCLSVCEHACLLVTFFIGP